LAVLICAGGRGAGRNQLPSPIERASVTHDGQGLVWYVRLAQAFSPASLGRDHASLCLLIE